MTETKIASLINNYRPSAQVIQAVNKAQLVLLVGISGAGKDTLKQRLLAIDGYYNFISYTTRQPRSNQGVMEVDGDDYYFIRIADAIRMLEQGDFIEAKKYSENVYGTSIKDLVPAIDSGLIAVNDVEVQGVDEYKKISNNVKAIFILPPTYDEWQRRLKARYKGDTADPNDINRRLKTAEEELKFALEQGYFEFVINDEIDHALQQVELVANGKTDAQMHQRGKRCAQAILDEISTH